MKKQWKGFILGVLVTTMIFTLAMPVAAAVRNLKADFIGIKITLDGSPLTPKDANGKVVEPFAVEGTTHLPLRAVAEALGLGVDWHGPTKTVRLTSNGGNQPPVATPTPKPNTGNQVSYKITNQKCELHSSLSSTGYTAFVEIENTGTSDLYLKEATFDFESKSGELLAAENMISSAPNVIMPGEKGYFYDSGILDGNISLDTDYVFKPTLKVLKSTTDVVRYNLSNVALTERDYNRIGFVGRVSNPTSEKGSFVQILIILYDRAGEAIFPDLCPLWLG